jgi:hypothetical protein
LPVLGLTKWTREQALLLPRSLRLAAIAVSRFAPNGTRTPLPQVVPLAILGFEHYIGPKSAKEADMISRIFQAISVGSSNVTVKDMPPKDPNDDDDEDEEDKDEEEEPVIREPDE